MRGWRPALRIARRSVRRHLGRSVLTIALIALPVAGVTVADGIVRTATDRDVDLDQTMGTADLRIDINGRHAFDVEPLLPKGSRAVPISTPYYRGSLRLTDGDRMVRTRLDIAVLGDPLTAHLARLASGRLPDGPGEVLLTRPLADRLDVLDGDVVKPDATVTALDGTTARVTGLAVEPYCLRCEGVVTSPGSVLEGAMLDGSLLPIGYLVDLPDGADAAALARSWPADESEVTTRESFMDTTPFGGYLLDAAAGPIALLAGLGLLVIVVSAGAAFAVGARRQVRELGLVAAEGGEHRHLRRIVLAQGFVLGVLGAATGLVLGGVVTVLGVPLWQRITGRLMDDLRFGWPELTGVAVVGVIASVVAAAVPAFGMARMRPVDALAGRFRAAAPTARFSMAGALLATGGLACVVAAGLLGRTQLAEPGSLPVLGVLAGTLMAVTGLVLVAPALVGAVGRFGTRLPLSGRLAVRDAVRHRGRTVAAITAVMITVTGAVAAAFVLMSRAHVTERTMPEHSILVSLDVLSRYGGDTDGAALLAKATGDMTDAVPGTVVHELTMVTPHDEGPGSAALFADTPMTNQTPECWNAGGGNLAVASDLMRRSAAPDAGVRAALAEGKVVVFDECLVSPAGTVRFTANLPEPVELPAYVARWRPGAESHRLVLSPMYVSGETNARLGWDGYTDTALVTHPATATEAQIATLRAAAEDAGVDNYVESDPADDSAATSFALVGFAGLVALLGAGVTVALAAADGRADLATLAALGASPRRRRMIAGAQALVVTGLGTVTGLVVGTGVGFASVPVDLTVPWPHLALTGLAVPLLTALVAMAATPGRLPMIQRRQS